MPTSTSKIICPNRDCGSEDATCNVDQHVVFGVPVVGVYETCNACDYGQVIIKVDRKEVYKHMGK